MPIQFRCTSCQQKLSITRRKAGKVVKCPACANDLPVPTLEEAAAAGQIIEPPPETTPTQKESPQPVKPRPAESTRPPVFEPEQPAFEPQPPVFDDDLDPSAFDATDDDEEDDAVESADAVDESADGENVGEEGQPQLEESLPRSAVVASTGPRVWEPEEDEEDEGFHLGRRPTDDGGLDMTPMVDVTFLLLIFFMITASFSVQKSMETEAPEPEKDGASQMPSMQDLADDSVIVEIDENDSIFVDDAQVASVAELADVLAAKMVGEQKREMIIEAHPQAKHGTVVQTTDAGIEVGMQRIRRVTRSQ